jgi:hypothetical protein
MANTVYENEFLVELSSVLNYVHMIGFLCSLYIFCYFVTFLTTHAVTLSDAAWSLCYMSCWYFLESKKIKETKTKTWTKMFQSAVKQITSTYLIALNILIVIVSKES